MAVREDEVVLPDGRPGVYFVVDKPDFALVVPREDDGSLWLVEQYRYPVGRRSWEFPQGSWDPRRAGRRHRRAGPDELRERRDCAPRSCGTWAPRRGARLLQPGASTCGSPPDWSPDRRSARVTEQGMRRAA
jgi:hypothetical protein